MIQIRIEVVPESEILNNHHATRSINQKEIATMKLQKKLKVMKGNLLTPFKEGEILVLNEASGEYRFGGGLRQSPFTAKELEAMPKSLIQPISADGLTLDEMKGREYQAFNSRTDEWENIDVDYRAVELSLLRIKPQPKYVLVPESIKLGTDVSGQGSIFNHKRVLFNALDDGLPIMSRVAGIETQPHQIDPREIGDFEDGQIYFAISGSENEYIHKDDIGFYGIYCKKLNNIYYFTDEKDYGLESIKAETEHLHFYRKVVEIK